jgi:hypothetical protein
METSVRVVVANRRELVLSTLSGQEGISVVGETENEQDVPSLVAATKPDFLLIALDEPQRRPALCCCRSVASSTLASPTSHLIGMDKIVLASFRWRKHALLWLRRLQFFLRRFLRHSALPPCGRCYQSHRGIQTSHLP